MLLESVSNWEEAYRRLQSDGLELFDNSKGESICRVEVPAEKLGWFATGLESELSGIVGKRKADQLRRWLVGDIGDLPKEEVFNFQLVLTEDSQTLKLYSTDGERVFATRNLPIGEGGKVQAMIPHLIPVEAAPDVLVKNTVRVASSVRPSPAAEGDSSL